MSLAYNTQLQINIDWADLDLFGHVNNVVFFKYIQTARVNYCEQIGLTSLDDKNKLSFMVASSQCRFKKPLYYPGQIIVKARIDWIKNSSFQLDYLIMKSEELIAEGTDIIVVFDPVNKTKVTMPDDMRARVAQVEEWPL
jgi:acyl-CoA thioester hydrolase